MALLDSNVVVAAHAEEHPHHKPSVALLTRTDGGRLAVAAHSFAEACSTLTRSGPRTGFGRSPADAWEVLESVAAATTLVGLTPGQTFGAIGLYARVGGIGPRRYDHLIGRVAVRHGIPRIVT